MIESILRKVRGKISKVHFYACLRDFSLISSKSFEIRLYCACVTVLRSRIISIHSIIRTGIETGAESGICSRVIFIRSEVAARKSAVCVSSSERLITGSRLREISVCVFIEEKKESKVSVEDMNIIALIF